MSKQLQTIIEKAHKTGFANVNGRYYIYYQGQSKLESKWQARYNKDTDVFELDHWGTNIVTLEQFSTFPLVSHIYGQSKSDRDALVQLFNYCGRNDFYVSYKPSTDQFVTKVQFVGKKELTDFII